MGNSINFKQPDFDPAMVDQAKALLRRSQMFTEISIFQREFEGVVLTPFDETKYHDARNRPFNLDQRGYPLLIVQPKSSQDVARALLFYRRFCFSESLHHITLCVECGGHSSKSMVSGSFVIDLQYLNSSEVNVEYKLITVGGGAYVKELDRALAKYNLAVPIGTYPVVGIGGLALGGGYGWLTRRHGLTVDYIHELEVVLVDGSIVIANEQNEHKELFWACRGGGGNFGIVTKFTFRCVSLPSKCFGGFLGFFVPTEDAASLILRHYDELVQSMDFDTSGSARLIAGSSSIYTAWAHCGEESSINEVSTFNQAKSLGGWLALPIEMSLKERSYHGDVQTMLTPFQTTGFAYVTIFPLGSSDSPMNPEFFIVLCAFARATPPIEIEQATVTLTTMGGAAVHADNNNTKTSIPDVFRCARYFAIIDVQWKSEYGAAGKLAARNWARRLLAVLAPFKTAGMKYAPDELQNGDLEQDFGLSSLLFRRLQKVKAAMDPQNILINNLNISPTATALSSGSSTPSNHVRGLGSPFSSLSSMAP